MSYELIHVFGEPEPQRIEIKDGVPENAVVAVLMKLHPDDFEAAKFALADEIEAVVYRATFGGIKIERDDRFCVPLGHALLVSAQGQRGLVRFR